MSLEILRERRWRSRARQGEDPRDHRQGHLRDDQRQGPVRRRAERDHADRLRAVPEGQAAADLAEVDRDRPSTSRRRAGSARAGAARCRSLDRHAAVGPAAVRGPGHRLALRAGRARAEPGLRHDAHAQRRARRRRDAGRIRRVLGVHARRRVAARRRPVVAALGGAALGYAVSTAVLFRRLLASGRRRPRRRLEGNSLLLFFGLSIIAAERRRARLHAEQPGLRVLGRRRIASATWR